jgi:hypothetical protein
MRHLIWYIQSLFCRHEWEHLGTTQYFCDGQDLPYKIADRWRCKKCGFIIKDER